MEPTIDRIKLWRDLARAAQARSLLTLGAFIALLLASSAVFVVVQGNRYAQYELKLMSWGDGSKVPASGKRLIVVGTDNGGLLHIRIFDPAGNLSADTDESRLGKNLTTQSSDLKQKLSGRMPPHALSADEKRELIRAAVSLAAPSPYGGVVLLLSFAGAYGVAWWMTRTYCRRAVLCPHCGGSLWACGSRNFKPRRIKVVADCCPQCQAKIV